MLIQDKIRNRRLELNLTMKDVAKAVGVAEATVSRWESGEIANMKNSRIISLAKILQISPIELMGENDNSTVFLGIIPFSEVIKKRVPILGDIACGKPIYANEQYGDFIDCGVDADFALTCRGDSMVEARINDGDLVFIKKQDIVENGAIAAVIIDNEATLKRVFYYPETEKLILQAANPQYEPLVYIGVELENVRILGRAVAFQSML